uniref:Uncharacterized protein n=1 Tax=Leersia perrieri TaxID=77586 RepID=A0A0D9W1Z6_9ORYZ
MDSRSHASALVNNHLSRKQTANHLPNFLHLHAPVHAGHGFGDAQGHAEDPRECEQLACTQGGPTK